MAFVARRIIDYRMAGMPNHWSFVARGRVVKECEHGFVEVEDLDTKRLVGVPEHLIVREVPKPEDQEPHVKALEIERSRLLEIRFVILDELAVADPDEEMELKIEKSRVDVRLGRVFEMLMKDALR